MDLADKIERIQVADIHPNDVVVIWPREGLSISDLRTIKQQAAVLWPDNKVVLVAGLDRIEIHRPAEEDWYPPW